MAHAPPRLPFLFFAEHRWDIPPDSGALRPAECRPSLSRVPGPFQRDPELPSAHRGRNSGRILCEPMRRPKEPRLHRQKSRYAR